MTTPRALRDDSALCLLMLSPRNAHIHVNS